MIECVRAAARRPQSRGLRGAQSRVWPAAAMNVRGGGARQQGAGCSARTVAAERFTPGGRRSGARGMKDCGRGPGVERGGMVDDHAPAWSGLGSTTGVERPPMRHAVEAGGGGGNGDRWLARRTTGSGAGLAIGWRAPGRVGGLTEIAGDQAVELSEVIKERRADVDRMAAAGSGRRGREDADSGEQEPRPADPPPAIEP